MGTLPKGMPLKCGHGKIGGVHSVTQHFLVVVWTNKFRARHLPRELMYVLSMLSTLRATIASEIREGTRKKWKPRRVFLGFIRSTSLPHPEQHTLVRTDGKEPEWWEPSLLWIHCITGFKKKKTHKTNKRPLYYNNQNTPYLFHKNVTFIACS